MYPRIKQGSQKNQTKFSVTWSSDHNAIMAFIVYTDNMPYVYGDLYINSFMARLYNLSIDLENIDQSV